MSRKKTIIEQSINLSDEVMVIVRWPKGDKPTIRWDGDEVFVSLDPLAVAPRPSAMRIVRPASNGPEYDTPEILAMKERLGAPLEKKAPLKTADLFGGEEPSPEALEQAAEMFAAVGDTVV